LYLTHCLVCLLGGELTGDTEGSERNILDGHDFIVTTPEKWDAVTRKLKDHSLYMDMVKLVLVWIYRPDGLSEGRRSTSPSGRTRTSARGRRHKNEAANKREDRRSKRNGAQCSRFGTMDRKASVGRRRFLCFWKLPANLRAINLEFGEEFRPVKLQRFCFGYPHKTGETDFQFDLKLNNV